MIYFYLLLTSKFSDIDDETFIFEMPYPAFISNFGEDFFSGSNWSGSYFTSLFYLVDFTEVTV